MILNDIAYCYVFMTWEFCILSDNFQHSVAECHFLNILKLGIGVQVNLSRIPAFLLVKR